MLNNLKMKPLKNPDDDYGHILTSKIPWLMKDPRTITLQTKSSYIYISGSENHVNVLAKQELLSQK